MYRGKLNCRNVSSYFATSLKPKYMHTSGYRGTSIGNQFLATQNIEEEALSRHFSSVLQACSGPSSIRQGRQVHAQHIVGGISSGDAFLGARILGMYVLCDSFADAKKMFGKIELGCTLPWNWMIRGFVKMGMFDFALLFYFKMMGCGILPDKYTFPCVVKACNGLNSVRMGKLVHETIVSMGFDLDVFAGSSLIKLYAENGFLDYAQSLFNKWSEKDCVLWNVMLDSYVKWGKGDDAARVFNDMRNSETRPNSVAFACILSLCSSEAMIGFGAQLHGLAVVCGLEFASQVANSLMAMYSKCGQCFDARKLFDLINHGDLVTWNAMISGYVQNRLTMEASLLLREMISAGVKPDSVTFSSFLPAVTESMSPKQGKEIHGYILRNGVVTDVFLKCALIDIYFKCREVKMACRIFNQSTTVDIGMCTAMISGYMFHGMNIDAVEVFRRVIQAKMRVNTSTLASVLPACAGLVALKLGKELHANILKNGVHSSCHVESAIMDMYAKCGRLDLAHQIFNGISERDTVSWNSMITNYSQNGKPMEAIDLFRQMVKLGVKYDSVSISQGLSACANLPALHYGKEIHGFMIKAAFSSNLFAESALLDMYAKCGHLKLAHHVFNVMPLKNEVSWNSIIAAYGFHGHLKECLSLYDEMLENGIQPDHVTFLGIISACGHVGLVDDGIRYFRCMTEEYGIQARMEHYACVVDLYSRGGRLTEAFETIKSMPFLPDAGVWGTLLGACRVHHNVEIAELASRHLFNLDPQNSGYYILLSNILADKGQWGGVLKIRSMMKERGVKKVPGYSWIEVNGITHMFVSADGSHPHSAQVYSMLETLLLELKREGYVPQP